MPEFKVIRHQDLTDDLLLKICEIKSVAWPHSVESQKNWIKANLRNDDYHILMFDSGLLKAYMNLVSTNIIANSQTVPALGVGNVCAANKGEGLGRILMEYANDFILNRKFTGLLFCKKELLSFYQKFNWLAVPKENTCFPELAQVNFETMVLTEDQNIETLEYRDRLF